MVITSPIQNEHDTVHVSREDSDLVFRVCYVADDYTSEIVYEHLYPRSSSRDELDLLLATQSFCDDLRKSMSSPLNGVSSLKLVEVSLREIFVDEDDYEHDHILFIAKN